MYKASLGETKLTSLLRMFITCYTTLQTLESEDSLLERESLLSRVL